MAQFYLTNSKKAPDTLKTVSDIIWIRTNTFKWQKSKSDEQFVTDITSFNETANKFNLNAKNKKYGAKNNLFNFFPLKLGRFEKKCETKQIYD